MPASRPSRCLLTALGLAIAVTAGAGACSEEGLTAPTSAAQVNGTWRLQQMTATGNAVHNEDLNANRFSATFSTGRVELKADCNTCTGAANISGATLSVNALACTRAACASAPLDTRFSAFFDGAITVRVNSRLLQLNSDRGELRLEK